MGLSNSKDDDKIKPLIIDNFSYEIGMQDKFHNVFFFVLDEDLKIRTVAFLNRNYCESQYTSEKRFTYELNDDNIILTRPVINTDEIKFIQQIIINKKNNFYISKIESPKDMYDKLKEKLNTIKNNEISNTTSLEIENYLNIIEMFLMDNK